MASPSSEIEWLELVDTAQSQGTDGNASAATQAGLKAYPRSHGLLARSARLALGRGDFHQAKSTVESLWTLRPVDPLILTMLGQTCAALDDHDLARAAFERALLAEPGNPQLLFNLATSLRNFGEMEEAERLYDTILASRPDDWEAHKNRSDLRRQTVDDNHLDVLTGALERARPDWRGSVMLHYAMGKEREDIGDYDGAFESYSSGARLRRAHMSYDVEKDVERMADIARCFDAEWLRTRAEGCQDPSPIFIFGLPRAGSTLLERMLGAHSLVSAGGELQSLGIALVRLAEQQPGHDIIERAARIEPRALGELYLSMSAYRRTQALFLTDKMPVNFLYAGLIATALPKAKMIHIHKDPMDAAIGMYKVLFKQAYPFSYDLKELGKYIDAQRCLMDHWQSVLGERLLSVRYEDIVTHPERELSRILAYAGLEYEEACLNVSENRNPVNTASAAQVRQPIYRTSIGAWRRFERHLAPLLQRAR